MSGNTLSLGQQANFHAAVIKALPRNVTPHDALIWEQNGEKLAVALASALSPIATPLPRHFPTWKTLRLGLYKTAYEYRKAMKSAKNKVGEWANGILGKAEFTCASQVTDVDLVVLSVAELGFKEGAKYSDICTRALELGLELCPAEVGPALRLAYKNQPKGEWLIIAMNAITDSDGDLNVFHVEHDNDELWLFGNNGHPDNFWGSVSRFVFVRRNYTRFSPDFSGEF